jgi:hypothetical protein
MYTTESYPNFFRIVPSEAAFNPARVALMRHFNWTRVGTIYQNSPRFSLVFNLYSFTIYISFISIPTLLFQFKLPFSASQQTAH